MTVPQVFRSLAAHGPRRCGEEELPLTISRKRRLRGIACPQSADDLRAARRRRVS